MSSKPEPEPSSANRDQSPSPPQQPTSIDEIPSRVPPPTGNLMRDSWESAKHVLDLPCSREAFMTGIAAGAGVGLVRGLASRPAVGVQWAVWTGLFLAAASREVCMRKIENERKRVVQYIESMPKRTVKNPSTATDDAPKPASS